MEIVIEIILLPIFIVMVSSTKFPPWDFDDVLSPEDQSEVIPEEHLEYGHPFRVNPSNEDSDYEYYWSFVPQPKGKELANFPAKEKKNGQSESLCMSTLIHKTFIEENGIIFKPDALIEYNCQAVPPGVYNNLEHLPERATICKVKGDCVTREREIRVFKKRRDSNRHEAKCWQQENYNLSVGCLCLNHF
ncbi:uncharacterized protein LOC123677845 [Harmonia axyridis]|uniref:uncharacterized protein LOC123677845 n=1 Tax=Harmonia axyridis TaxID=115357 RepID=UPI001E2759E7|nr:uncharacterized protein LOC123677845 [Harmonia axyridis]